MASSTPNLQNRSFRRQTLTNADFHGADLRGADFRGAILRGATFRGARLGRSPWQWAQLIAAIALTAWLTGKAVTGLIFAALGQPMQDTAGMLVIVLHSVSLGTGAAIALPSRYRIAVGSGGVGILIGFFYGGTWFDQALMPAMVGAVLGLSLGVGLSGRWRSGLGAIVGPTAIALTSGGAVFLLWTTAIAGLTTGHPLGWAFTLLTLLYFAITGQWTGQIEAAIAQYGGTSFQDADLTGADFSDVQGGLVHWEGAIGSNAIAPPTKP
ncbi:pentapeptide repeat-containing protein [Spirulina major CS-329]|uniref:pentapeptide repeat-containing protein n=1 Tax=Spirulina TaxID=1154 RepID=UPI00232CF83A|nr:MULTISPECIES: pentapeptide repeat-containing protein [Spirulina]MDB9493049.1 pentapeptide repeat-containing protein [Spirulina subsalsa CS-330]MDB9501918.1 pentapeptide repeat-containing protein [Spirulina major CS-329]